MEMSDLENHFQIHYQKIPNIEETLVQDPHLEAKTEISYIECLLLSKTQHIHI